MQQQQNDVGSGGFVNWRPDPEWHSANRAEKAIVGSYELVAFDIPKTGLGPAEIGWEVFGGSKRLDQLASGQTKTFDEAKAAAEAAWRAIVAR